MKKDSSSQTIVHAKGKDVQGLVAVDRIPGKLGVFGSWCSKVSSRCSV